MRTQILAVITVVSSGCFQAEEEVGLQSASRDLQTAPAPAAQAEPTPALPSTCAGTVAPAATVDEASASAKFQGRWLRCGVGAGRLDEASPLARETLAFEVVGDRWFVLEQGADGRWERAEGEGTEGTLSWWTTSRVGVTFSFGNRGDPALMEFLSGGVRLDFYPGAEVLFVPLDI